jgi:hypothetical protein
MRIAPIGDTKLAFSILINLLLFSLLVYIVTRFSRAAVPSGPLAGSVLVFLYTSAVLLAIIVISTLILLNAYYRPKFRNMHHIPVMTLVQVVCSVFLGILGYYLINDYLKIYLQESIDPIRGLDTLCILVSFFVLISICIVNNMD